MQRYNCIVNTVVSAIIITHSILHVKKLAGELGEQPRKEWKMSLTQKRILILLILIVIAAVLGRLTVRAVLNLLVGGTMFGGNFL